MKKILLVALLLLIMISTAYSKAFLGIYPENISESKYDELNLPEHYGILVTKIDPNSPAENAGILPGDIILKINDEKIYTCAQLKKMFSAFEPNITVKVNLKSDEKKFDLQITLAKALDSPKRAYLGLYLEDITPEYSRKIKLNKNYGVRIENIEKNGPSAKVGIINDDILLKINDEKIYTTDQVEKMLQNYRPGDKISALIYRNRKTKKIIITLGEIDDSEDINIFGGNPTKNNLFFWKSNDNNRWIGVKTTSLSAQSLQNYGVKNGIMISEVIPDSPAEAAGLKANDIIISADSTTVRTVWDLKNAISNKEIDETMTLKIKRNGKIKKIRCKIGQNERFSEFKNFNLPFTDGKLQIWKDGELKTFDWDNLKSKGDEFWDKFRNMKLLDNDNIDDIAKKLEELDNKIDVKKILKKDKPI